MLGQCEVECPACSIAAKKVSSVEVQEMLLEKNMITNSPDLYHCLNPACMVGLFDLAGNVICTSKLQPLYEKERVRERCSGHCESCSNFQMNE